ncbi:KTSC domain-containing protein [Pseudaminobacter sp. NGMCC 1.201702]|uniref:KTSC domain-containing protein n=1 Tax=Pseudaminobacter sp. NGMCC 1.201702 TaxID=3391825 RepID=UPI0039F06F46
MPSTLIRNIEYDEATKTLSVRLVTTNDRYVYEGVDPRTYQAFKSAFVKGRFFNRFIRGQYKYRVVAEDDDG